jgi:arylsulfatase A-like enzyme
MANRFLLVFFVLLTFPVKGHAPSENTGEIQSRPNILWLTLEDTSEYQFGCYGNTDINTPTIDILAEKGIRFTHASSTAPHCSPARSTLITGCYATTYGMDVHREDYETPADIFYTSYLRQSGYYCTNNSKTDYNSTIDDKSLWDECGREATYNSPLRKPGQPFFSVFNTEATHMGRIRSISLEGRRDFKALGIDPEKLFLPAHVPDLPAMRSDEAYQLEASREADRWVKAFLDDLEDKGLADNTIVFFFSDHGGCLPRGKGFPFESGLQIPLVIYIPPGWQEKFDIESGMVSSELVGFVDFAPTILSLAGIKPPDFMQGRAFLGPYAGEPGKYQFGFRTNQENYHFDPCRTVTDGRYKYIRNYIPHKPFCLRNLYQWGMPANLAWDQYILSGECTQEEWLQPYRPKQPELLFDLTSDPWELQNLANDPRYAEILHTMRIQISKHIRETGDLGFFVRGRRKKPGGLYHWVRESDFPVNELIEAAEMASMPAEGDVDGLTLLLGHPVPEMRFWGAIGFNTLGSRGFLKYCPEEVLEAIHDSVPEVAAAAAEAACYLGENEKGIAKLIELLESNFSPAYSSLETLTWYADQKVVLKAHSPELRKLLDDNSSVDQDRMGLDIKLRSLLVNLGDIPISELYSKEEKEKGIRVNQNPRKFRYPSTGSAKHQ